MVEFAFVLAFEFDVLEFARFTFPPAAPQPEMSDIASKIVEISAKDR